MNAIISCRVSAKEQAEKGYSLEGQEKACCEFAKSQGFEVDRVFIERGESAKTQDRTQLQSFIKYCIQNKKQLSALIIWKLDRLARNLSDQTELLKNFSSLGMRIYSATENNENNATGKLMRNIIGTFAQFENNLKSERTTNGMKQAIQQGRWCWRAPFGYKGSRDDKSKPLIVPAENSKTWWRLLLCLRPDFINKPVSSIRSGTWARRKLPRILLTVCSRTPCMRSSLNANGFLISSKLFISQSLPGILSLGCNKF